MEKIQHSATYNWKLTGQTKCQFSIDGNTDAAGLLSVTYFINDIFPRLSHSNARYRHHPYIKLSL